MIVGGIYAESSAKGLLVNINLPLRQPVILNAGSNGAAAPQYPARAGDAVADPLVLE